MSKVNVENGKKLRGFRKQNKITQLEISTIVGRSRRAVGFWEEGKTSIPSNIIKILNKKYNLKLKDTISTPKSTTKTTKTTKSTKAVKSTKSVKSTKKINSVITLDRSKVRTLVSQISEPLTSLLEMIYNA